jgi:peptidoglycan/LPS O-acetylase OafA/YrhL
MRTVGYRDRGVDLAFTAVLAMPIRGNRGLLRLFRWRVAVWIGTISEGFYFLHIPGLRHHRPGRWRPAGNPTARLRRAVFPLRTAISWAWFFTGLVFVGVVRVADFRAE